MYDNFTGINGQLYGINAGHSLNLPVRHNYLEWEQKRVIQDSDYLYEIVQLTDFDYVAIKKGMWGEPFGPFI